MVSRVVRKLCPPAPAQARSQTALNSARRPALAAIIGAGLAGCSGEPPEDSFSLGVLDVGESEATNEGLDEASTDAGVTGSEGADGSGDADTGEATTGTSDDASELDEGGVKWDLFGHDIPPDCGGGGGSLSQSMIWIANSAQGSVSKIDTQTLVEVGRYWVRPDHGGSPSRTSVNRAGDAVVAARTGGVTMVRFDAADCEDTNGTPGVQTSSGAADILDWDQEECRGWHTPTAHASIRALAWTAGEWDPETCEWTGAKVWVGADFGTSGSAEVLRLDGETGLIEDTVPLPDMEMSLNVGPYGAVVDGENNLWLAQIYAKDLTRVDHDTLEVSTWQEPIHTYGIAYHDDHVYLCNREISRFDPVTEAFTTALVEDWNGFYGHTGGCMVDSEGVLWKAVDDTLYGVDTESLAVLDSIAMPEGMQWGVAVDFDGYVWTIPRDGSRAYRVDPIDHSIETVEGLVGAYTYSDMTGFSLDSAAAG